MGKLDFKREKLHPKAAQAQRIRKAVGDNNFQPIADVMREGVKRERESRKNDKAMGH